MDLASVTAADFMPLIGSTFTFSPSGGQHREAPLVTTLVDVSEGSPGVVRNQFSLIFRGPTDDTAPQGIYVAEHDTAGRLEIFLVPIGPDGQGFRYQAVFG